ncbi:MAG: peptidoglycan bridge formation glycyltransferase FemA/FemB family protein [Candidatus Sungbacteria bacterium]|nr:peptidoglycan bridge formation glycyltransferase FemA/FemB family protein [Candidatus Sungbacteria bacterium]
MIAAQSFLQSPEWEGFERSLGRDTWRIADTLVIKRDLPLGLNYLYCPRPDFGIRNQELGIRVLDGIKKIAAQERSIFLKIDPLISLPPTTYHLQPSLSIQPRETLILDIAGRPESGMLAAMHEKTRYNIRLAERKGVTVKNFQFSIFNFQSEQFEVFWKLIQETAARDGFRTHPREYYKKLLGTRSEMFSNELFIAEYQGKALAAALINFYGNTATYLHGASSGQHREVMAPHLLHWRIIQEALRRGYGHYDWWGIDERRWSGVTRFKRGFGGRQVAHPPSVNIAYRRVWYTFYAAAKRGKV